MKIILTLVVAALAMTAQAGNAIATERLLDGRATNPNFVVYYPDGLHGIVGEFEDHEGEDLVMRAGQSGNFQQWFYGVSPSEGLHGEHSIWQEKHGEGCPNDFILVPDAFPEWGDYLTPNTDYCVKTNDFQSSNIPGL